MLFVAPNVVWIVLMILFSVIDQNHAAYLRCYRTCFTNHTEVELDSPDCLITDSDPCIDVEKDTMFLGNGFDNDPNHGNAIKTLISTYIEKKKLNVILVNWAKESKGLPGLGPLGYPIAVKNTKTVGEQLGKAILRLRELGLCGGIHLIGHSLGAHIMGFAGRHTKKHGFTVPWITGLDPARPGIQIEEALSKHDAEFVDLHHCDPGGYGLNESMGHVDIYANFGLYLDGTDMQPGCKKSLTIEELGSGGNRCSHDRAWQYYNYSICDPERFKIGRASNYYEWVDEDGNFDDEDVTYLGPKIDKTKRGNFYYTTSDHEPWGLGDKGLCGCDPKGKNDNSVLSTKLF